MPQMTGLAATSAAVALACGLAPVATAGDHTVVANADLTFTPGSLTIAQGDTVTFVNGGGCHNAMATSGPTTFRCANGCDGAGGDGDVACDGWTATVTFPSPGQVQFFCQAHGEPGLGMAGVININIPVELQSFEVE